MCANTTNLFGGESGERARLLPPVPGHVHARRKPQVSQRSFVPPLAKAFGVTGKPRLRSTRYMIIGWTSCAARSSGPRAMGPGSVEAKEPQKQSAQKSKPSL